MLFVAVHCLQDPSLKIVTSYLQILLIFRANENYSQVSLNPSQLWERQRGFPVLVASVNEAVSRKAEKNRRVIPSGDAHFARSQLCLFIRNSAPGNNRLFARFPSFLRLYSPLLRTQPGLCFLTPWSNFLNSHCTV